MRIVTVSLLEEEPPVRLTFSLEFYAMSPPSQLLLLGRLVEAFKAMQVAIEDGLSKGLNTPTLWASGGIPPDVTISRGRRRR